MTVWSQRQFVQRPNLACLGDCARLYSIPTAGRTYEAGLLIDAGVTGDLRCEACGGPLSLVGVVTHAHPATLADLDGYHGKLRDASALLTYATPALAVVAAAVTSRETEAETAGG